MKQAFSVFCLVALVLPAAAQPAAFDSTRLLADVQTLAADSLEGRRAGTEGNRKARRYLLEAFRERGIEPFEGGYARPFAFRKDNGEAVEGVNVVGYVEGQVRPDSFIVVTAHYDHLGIQDGQVYNGADDNASGTAGLLALAAHFTAHPPRHSLVFAALDAEEMGLQGARAFLDDPPIEKGQIVLNVNLDMISRSEAGELYAAGTYHYPALKPPLERVADRSDVRLLFGHDRPDLPSGDDWTMASDHGPFHERGIPFVYFGVEDHAGYHKPSDDFEDITPAFFTAAVRTILDAITELDRAGSLRER